MWAAPRRAPQLGAWPLTIAAGAAAGAPVIVSTVRAVRVGWEPTDDNAIIATRAYDVLTGHTPLVGQYSEAGYLIGRTTRDLGPMLYWLLALPVRLAHPWAMAVTMGAVNFLCVIATVALARRRGGLPLMLATAVAIPVMSMSLAAETFHDIWNPAAALFPFLLLIFLCWSVACGDVALLPLAVLLASFVVQAHLGYLAPTAGMLAIALVGLAFGGRRRVPWVLVALLVAIVCWEPAIIDEVTGHPGNLTLVVRTATAHTPTLGTRVGENAVMRALGLRPWWLIDPATRWDRKYDVVAAQSPLRAATTIALLAALAAVAVAGAVRRRRDLAAAGAIGLVLCAALAAVAAHTPTMPVLAATVAYSLWWGSQCGMWVWLIVAWSAFLLVRALAPASGRRVTAVAAFGGLAAVAVAGTAAAAAEKPDQHVALYRPIATIDARLNQALPRTEPVRFDGRLNVATQPVKASIRYDLARRGDRVLSTGAAARDGEWYELDHRPYRAVVSVSDRRRRPHRHAALLARVAFTEGGPRSSVYVWLTRQAVTISRTSVRRMWLPEGSRKPESIPYGRSSGSSTNSTPRDLSSS
jgi:hypothetical protein